MASGIPRWPYALAVITRWHSLAPLARDAIRLALALAVTGLVLGGAYLAIQAPGSGSAVVVDPPQAPVKAAMTARIGLGRSRVVLQGGPAGVFLVRRLRQGPPGSITRVDTGEAKLGRTEPLNVAPLGLGVGKHSVWVLGGERTSTSTTLLRVDPNTLRVTRRLVLPKASSCATHPFASCNPVVVADGVWVPLIDRLVHVTPDARMADLSVPFNGYVWALTSSGNTLWALAETALYRIDSATGIHQRTSLRDALGPGLHSNNIVASRAAVWFSSFPTNRAELGINRLTLVDPRAGAAKLVSSRPYPGSGSLALLSGGLWVDRFDGQGELDRLDARDGSITGPILVVPGDITWIVTLKNQLWITVFKAASDRRELIRITLTPTS
jgi:hypothetical protein